MITEDYCSFEVAKLLKEKGFEDECFGTYSVGDHELSVSSECPYENDPNDDILVAAPTHQMAIKWLREVRNIEINVSMSALNSDNSREYMFNIFFTNERYLEPSKTKTGFKCYEEAAEAAIKYCLTNLIK